MKLEKFKDDFAISKGYEDFAQMTRKELILNEDWHTYNDLINDMLKLFNLEIYDKTVIEWEVNEINEDLFGYEFETDDESGVTYYIKPVELTTF